LRAEGAANQEILALLPFCLPVKSQEAAASFG